MVSWTTNHVALRRMKAEMRFQWMMFLRHRILLGQQGQADDQRDKRREGMRDRLPASCSPCAWLGKLRLRESGADWQVTERGPWGPS